MKFLNYVAPPPLPSLTLSIVVFERSAALTNVATRARERGAGGEWFVDWAQLVFDGQDRARFEIGAAQLRYGNICLEKFMSTMVRTLAQ